MGSIVARVSKATKAPMDKLLSSAEAWEMVRAGYFTRTHQKELAKQCWTWHGIIPLSSGSTLSEPERSDLIQTGSCNLLMRLRADTPAA